MVIATHSSWRTCPQFWRENYEPQSTLGLKYWNRWILWTFPKSILLNFNQNCKCPPILWKFLFLFPFFALENLLSRQKIKKKNVSVPHIYFSQIVGIKTKDRILTETNSTIPFKNSIMNLSTLFNASPYLTKCLKWLVPPTVSLWISRPIK